MSTARPAEPHTPPPIGEVTELGTLARPDEDIQTHVADELRQHVEATREEMQRASAQPAQEPGIPSPSTDVPEASKPTKPTHAEVKAGIARVLEGITYVRIMPPTHRALATFGAMVISRGALEQTERQERVDQAVRSAMGPLPVEQGATRETAWLCGPIPSEIAALLKQYRSDWHDPVPLSLTIHHRIESSLIYGRALVTQSDTLRFADEILATEAGRNEWQTATAIHRDAIWEVARGLSLYPHHLTDPADANAFAAGVRTAAGRIAGSGMNVSREELTQAISAMLRNPKYKHFRTALTTTPSMQTSWGSANAIGETDIMQHVPAEFRSNTLVRNERERVVRGVQRVLTRQGFATSAFSLTDLQEAITEYLRNPGRVEEAAEPCPQDLPSGGARTFRQRMGSQKTDS